MPTCKKCNEYFPCRIRENGKTINLFTRKYCLECSPRGMHNTRKLEIIEKGCLCKMCGRSFEYDRQKGHQYQTCNSCLVEARHTKVKQKAVDYLGGKCVSCGYNRCIKALEFHHKDNEKGFQIGGSYNRSWESIQKELDRCIVVCSNCHREHHDGMRNLGEYVSG